MIASINLSHGDYRIGLGRDDLNLFFENKLIISELCFTKMGDSTIKILAIFLKTQDQLKDLRYSKKLPLSAMRGPHAIVLQSENLHILFLQEDFVLDLEEKFENNISQENRYDEISGRKIIIFPI